MSAGIKRIIRMPGVEDENEQEANVLTERDISHLDSAKFEQMYRYRLNPDQKERLQTVW